MKWEAPTSTELITLKQFAEARGHSVTPTALKRLRRRLTKKQRKTGKAFLIQASDAPNAALLTTEALMREHCPEFFDRRAEARALVLEWAAEFRDRQAEFNQKLNGLGARVKLVNSEVKTLAVRVDSLAAPSDTLGPIGTRSQQG